MSATRQPWMKFYPADWRADQALRICGIAARGLWVECMALMHEADPYGYLVHNGKPITNGQLSVLAGVDKNLVGDLLGELEGAGVFSRNRQGVIFSRRMVKDKKKAEIGRKSVQKRCDRGNGQDVETHEEIDAPTRPPCSPATSPSRARINQKPEARVQKPEARKGTPSVVSPAVVDAGQGPDPPPPADPLPMPAIPLEFDRTAPAVMVKTWNALAERLDLAQVQRLTKGRIAKAKARYRDCDGKAGWQAALDAVERSPFLRGENDRGWRADFDFVLQESSFTKLMEGGYDRGQPTDGGELPPAVRAAQALSRS